MPGLQSAMTALSSVLDWFFSLPAWARIPAYLALLWATYRASVAVFSQFVYWRTRYDIIKSIEKAAQSPDAPAIDKSLPVRVYLPPSPSFIDETVASVSWLSGRLTNRAFEVVELTKTYDSADTAYVAAVYMAGRARGLGFLPEKMRHPIHLRIALRHVTEAKAPPAARTKIEAELEGTSRGMLYDALFDPATLAEVDLTPGVKGGSEYFTKYFQPMMTVCSERNFSQSAGENEISEQQLLVTHLKLLSEKRVRGAKFIGGSACLASGEWMKASMPRQLPSQYKKFDRKQAVIFNAKKAAAAVIFIADAGGANEAKRHEMLVEAHFKQLPEAYPSWTSQPGPGGDGQTCLLWQRVVRD